MSIQPLQERIVSVLGEQGPVKARELRNWLQNTDLIAIDCAVKALMKANKVSLTLGAYDLVRVAGAPRKPVASLPLEPPRAVPPRLRKAAAAVITVTACNSTLPPPPTFECGDCHEPLPDAAFRHSFKGNRYTRCIKCHAKLMRAAKAKTATGPEGTEAVPPKTELGERPPTPSESPPPNTPSEHPPVVNPQTVNLQGTVAESMEQAGSAPTTARASMSLPTSPHHPAAGSVAAGRPPGSKINGAIEPTLAALVHKRAWLVQKREALRLDYEGRLKALDERIEAIDRVRMLEEGA